MGVSAATERPAAPEWRGVVGWSLYDWANSPFPTLVLTFVIPAYFAQAVTAEVTTGTAQWGVMQTLASLAIAALSPVLGAIADRRGGCKPWIAGFTLLMAATTALLWTVRPQPDDAMRLLWLVGVALVAFELAIVFYNAMLPHLVPDAWLGRVSGWAWGLGYLGGLVALIVVLFGFVRIAEPPFGLDRETAEHVRISGPFVAVWAVVFCLPLFLLTPDSPGQGLPMGEAMRTGLETLRKTLRQLPRHPTLGRFLLARLLYTDGINTIFVFGGIYAAGTFGLAVEQVIVFGILLNVTAGLGAFAFGWLDDAAGPKLTILLSLGGLVIVGIPLLLVESVTWFWILGVSLGLFVGPVQAASRSLMARLAPEGMEREMFGLYALSGRIAAVLGPPVVSGLTVVFASQRIGLATIVPFLLAGGAVLLTIRDPRL
ncbi:MAG: MFS transporter [Alphaproteobacteria bacterium]